MAQKENGFLRLNNFIRSSEASLVNLMSSIAPWLAPVAPARMTYMNLTDHLKFDFASAIIVALVVEMLGLSTISTSISFWSHNKRYMNRRDAREYKRAPTWLSVASFSIYLLVIIFLNVLLDAAPTALWSNITARLLLTLLSVPAAVTLAIRTQHAELLAELARKKTESFSNNAGTLQEALQLAERLQSGVGKLQLSNSTATNVADWRKLSEEEKKKVAGMTIPEIRDIYPINERTAYLWKSKVKENGNGHGSG